MSIADKLVTIADNMQKVYNAGKSQGGGGVKLDHTVTFTVDGAPYEIVSVKRGNSVNAPATEPTSENGSFAGWLLNGAIVGFPYAPTSDTEITAHISTLINLIYDNYNVDKNVYPYVFVNFDNYKKVKVIFTNGYQITSSGTMFLPNAPHLYGTGANVNFTDYDNVETALTIAIEKVTTLETMGTAYNYSGHTYTNADIGECADNFHSI